MKYFIDTEFIEGFWNAVFYKPRHFIDLISIGIFREDGKFLYRISNEYNYKDADKWVKENVLIPAYTSYVSGDQRNRYDASNFNKYLGYSNKQIANDIQEFMEGDSNIEFYGYYADYDWVLFCSLFGRMIDLPKGFPMYCRDLKQMLDELYFYQENKYPYETRLESWLREVKQHPDYPKQKEEHHALNDALWNKELYDFIVQKKFLNKSGIQSVTETKKLV